MKLYLTILSIFLFIPTCYASQAVSHEQARVLAAKHGLTLKELPEALADANKKTTAFNKKHPHEVHGQAFHEYVASLSIKNIEDLSTLISWQEQQQSNL